MWKPSVFNVFHLEDGRYHYFNSTSTAAFSLRLPEHELAQSCLAEIAETGRCSIAAVEDLLALGSFIVPYESDECAEEHQRFVSMKRSDDWAFLSIVPTFACNLRCSYCFQSRKPMPLEPVNSKHHERLVGFFRELAGRVKGVAVLWFGGEPLLALQRIEWLTRRFKRVCEEHGIRYLAEMMTNGSLLNEHSLPRLRELSLHKLEISIDGLPQSYSQRKGLKLQKALEFYELLFRHADRLIEAAGSLVLRINVDRDNVQEARETVQKMRRECDAVDKIDFRLQLLSAGGGLVECIPHNCYSQQDAATVRADFAQFLAAEGLDPHSRISRVEHPCMAVRKYAYTVDPSGGIGKCVPATGRPGSTIFNLCADDSGSVLDQLAAIDPPYASFDPFMNGPCRDCAFLPVCLGQCPRDHGSGNFVCVRKKELNSRLALQAPGRNAPEGCIPLA